MRVIQSSIVGNSFYDAMVEDIDLISLAALKASREDTPIHQIADAHEPKFSVAVRHAFAMGRRALGQPPNPTKAAAAVRAALGATLEPALARCLAAGGEAALGRLNGLKAAGSADQARDEHGRWTNGGADSSFPRASSVVDGRQVLDNVPNESSIESSLNDYKVLPGIREVQMSSMDPEYQVKPYSVSESKRLDELQAKIEASKTIAPLIIVIDKEKHPYILEGGHRFDALRRMGAKSFPAKVVLDLESLRALGSPDQPRDEHGQWTSGASLVGGHKLELTERGDTTFVHVRMSTGSASNMGRVTKQADGYHAHAADVKISGPHSVKGDAIKAVLERSGFRSLASPTSTHIRFDSKNVNAANWARDHAAELIKGISDTTEQRIRDAVARAEEEGDLRDQYDEILNAVGDEDRAQLIARTESMTAANEGQRQGWDQAVEHGLLDEESKRVWIATGGCCDDCDDLDETETTLDGEYPEPGGDGPPLHPNCRCTEGIVS